MFPLSTNAKEAIKLGLAMTIAYYVALRFSWFSAAWAAIAVAMISLPTQGQSLNKGLLRMGGTLIALVAGLFYLGLFPQDRWLFLLSFTPYLAFVTYMVQGKSGQYLWFCAGFVAMMITTAGPGSSEHAFEFAVFRTVETLVGIVIWTLVSTLIWPRTNLGTLKDVSRKLLATQQKLVSSYRDQVSQRDPAESAGSLLTDLGKLVTQLGQTIGAAASEAFEVREVRQLLERFQRLSSSTMQVMARLHAGIPDLPQIDLNRVLPGLDEALVEVDSRFQEAGRVLSGQAQVTPPGPFQVALSDTDFEGLSPFQRAAVEVTRRELERLEELTRAMVECAGDIQGYRTKKPGSGVSASEPGPIVGPFGLPPLDPDRVRGVIMVVASMWISFLVWIYVNPPGHISWYQFVPNIALVAVQHQQVPFQVLKPFAYAYSTALLVYIFILPQLSVFWELGVVIFAFSFGAAYFFHGAGRVAVLLALFNMLGINNEQTYNFAAMANTFLFTMLGMSLFVALTYITSTPRPEKAFMRLVGRFFRSCEYLVCRVETTSVLQRMRFAFHFQELKSLPAKLGVWGIMIDHKKFPENTPDQVSGLVASSRDLADRVEELIETRRDARVRGMLQKLPEEYRRWRTLVEKDFESWSGRSKGESEGQSRDQLSSELASLRARIEESVNQAEEGELGAEQSKSFYRLLGTLSRLTKVVVDSAKQAAQIDWEHWREERF